MNSPQHFLTGLDADRAQNLLQQLKGTPKNYCACKYFVAKCLKMLMYWPVHCAFSPIFALSRPRLSEFQQPVKNHNEVIGHGRAVDWVVSCANGDNNTLTFDDLFTLHRLVQTEQVWDIYRPYGAWKKEPNGTTGRDAQGKVQFIEFAAPEDVPWLMQQWVATFNAAMLHSLSESAAVEVFADLHTTFTAIHPFWDGNGRMARLLANMPLLRFGLPPIVIQRTHAIREQYIGILQTMQQTLGVFSRHNAPLPLPQQHLAPLIQFCRAQWQPAIELVQQAHAQQKKRG